MAKFVKNSTTINEAARRELSITRDDYALCKYFHYRQGYSNKKTPGWCNDDKSAIAEFIGITRAGLYKMIDRLERLKLVETDPATGAMRATDFFLNTDNECKQSLQKGQSKRVNKVDSKCKQSLQSSVNKVTDKELMYSKNISKNELEQNQSLNESKSGFVEPLKDNPSTQKENVPPPPAAKFPAAWVALIDKAAKRPPAKMQHSSERVWKIEMPDEIAAELLECSKDALFMEQFKRTAGRKPTDTVMDLFTAFLDRRLIEGEGGYQNKKEFRRHLLNFPAKYILATQNRPEPPKQQSKQNAPQIPILR